MQEPLENQLIKASPGGSHPRLRRAASPMAWGQSGAVMALYHSGVLADIVIILGILGVFYGITQVGREWAGVLRPTVVIDLSFRALPRYTLFSLVRGLAAYCISFLFTLSLIHISEPTRLGMISYAVFCLKKKKKKTT